MFKMDLRTLCDKLVEYALVGKGRTNEALYLNFDVRLSLYKGGVRAQTYYSSRGLHLLYHNHPHMSTISVFSAVTESPFARVGDIKEWKHVTSHDSCWRDVRTLSDTYFEMAEEINALLKADGYPEVAPAEMSESNTFRLMGPLYEWLPCEVTKDPTDHYNYKRIITLTNEKPGSVRPTLGQLISQKLGGNK